MFGGVESSLRDPRFRQSGGFRRFDLYFGGKLDLYIEELSSHLYEV